jgi:hypothetical protein
LFSPIAGQFDWETTLRIFPVFLVFSVLFVAVLGVPSFLVLLALRLVRWWSTLLAGLFLGALVGVLVRLPNLPQLQDLFVMGGTGTASAFAFWAAWTQRRDLSD